MPSVDEKQISLPVEIILHILRYSSGCDLVQWQRVSRTWQSMISCDTQLWRNHCEQTECISGSWKDIFKEQYLLSTKLWSLSNPRHPCRSARISVLQSPNNMRPLQQYISVLTKSGDNSRGTMSATLQNGFLCITNHDQTLCVMNEGQRFDQPSTGPIKWIEPRSGSDYIITNEWKGRYEGGHVSVWKMGSKSVPARLYSQKVMPIHHIGYSSGDLYACSVGWWVQGPVDTTLQMYKVTDQEMTALWSREMGHRIMEIVLSKVFVACLVEQDRGKQAIILLDASTGQVHMTITDAELQNHFTVQKLYITDSSHLLVQSLGKLFVYTFNGVRIASHDLSASNMDISPLFVSKNLICIPSFNHTERVVILDLLKGIKYESVLTITEVVKMRDGLFLPWLTKDGHVEVDFLPLHD